MGGTMARKKKFVLINVEDPVIKKFTADSYVDSLRLMGDLSEQLEEEMRDRSDELLSMKEAYEYLKKNGVDISFRSFSGRIERGRIPVVKLGRKRYIQKEVLDNIIDFHQKFLSLKEAYERLKKVSGLNYRAFLGKVEKGTIPHVRVNGRRYIARDVVDALVHLHQNYYTISDVMEIFKRYGIKIKRNTLERRVDRGTIPHVKVGGKRYIHKDVVDQLIRAELGDVV
ncbi:MAG: helix-turn-helix domain-containing protein [Candidatus Micrarchaeota archaeon]|nr:helix-turn-helix domain-containing protein [Candidatus Micrarchaeota archaeon]